MVCWLTLHVFFLLSSSSRSDTTTFCRPLLRQKKMCSSTYAPSMETATQPTGVAAVLAYMCVCVLACVCVCL